TSLSPRARSYSTVTICCHQEPTPYWSERMATISLCFFFAAPAASSASNHSGQVLPVFAFTASSLIDGLIVAPIRCPPTAATLNRLKFLTRWRSSFLSVHLKNASGQRHALLQLPATRGLHPRLPVHHIEFHR